MAGTRLDLIIQSSAIMLSNSMGMTNFSSPVRGTFLHMEKSKLKSGHKLEAMKTSQNQTIHFEYNTELLQEAGLHFLAVPSTQR